MWDNKKTKATPKDGPCMSEFEGKAVVPGCRDQASVEFLLGRNRPETVIPAQMRTAPKGRYC